MNKCLVFLPGIMGSELENSQGEKVWPPKGLELLFGYKRIKKLLDPNLKPTKAIRNVLVVGVYKSLIEDFNQCGYFHGNKVRELLEFAYDWRLPNEASARKLSKELDKLEDSTQITIVAHSMGGLIARHLIESGIYKNERWFKNIKQLITLATPHQGAPEALRQVMGLESKARLSPEDIKSLSSNSLYPSAFQLTPDPTSALTIKKNDRGEVPSAIETFSSEIQGLPNVDLNKYNIKSALSFWKSLDISNKPDHISYFFFGGANHKTFARNEITGNALDSPILDNSGDGTVPITSSILDGIPHGYSMKNHSKIFTDRNLRNQLYHFLEAPLGIKPFSADDLDADENDFVGISLNKEEFNVGEPIELSVSYNLPKTNPIESFSILEIDVQKSSNTNVVYSQKTHNSITIRFSGVNVMESKYLLDVSMSPGIYELKSNMLTDDPEPTYFSIIN